MKVDSGSGQDWPDYSKSISPKSKKTKSIEKTIAEPITAEKVSLDEFVEEMISIINDRFKEVERNIRKLETDVTSLSLLDTEISRLKEDIRDIRADVTSIKSDISSLKGTPKLTIDKSALKTLKK